MNNQSIGPIALVVIGVVFSIPSFSSTDKKHEAHSESHEESEGKHHEESSGKQAEHSENEKEHEHEEESSGNVGPDKGILEANEKLGIKLSPEAIKNFEITTLDFKSNKQVKLSKSAIFFGLEEKNIYRLRDGFFKRIDFKQISRSEDSFLIESKELKDGDKIVLSGLGFLRTAETAAFGGVNEGHSH